MPRVLDPTKRVLGGVCARHPELQGLRLKSNHTCIQCDRDAQRRRADEARKANGKEKRVPMSAEQAKERIRQRDLIRGRKRREAPDYNEKQIVRKRKWRAENAEKNRATSRVYDAKQRAENIQRRLSKNLRHRLRKAMLGETRGISAVRDLGMSIPDFRTYLEGRFTSGMSWGNYGEWHVDHIRPLISFDLTDDRQAKAACHYSNLQPLWAADNHSKGCKPHPTIGVKP